MEQTKSRKYRFQVVDVTPAPPDQVATYGSRSVKRWRRRNARFQVLDLQTGAAAESTGGGVIYRMRSDAQDVARNLNRNFDGRKPRKSTRKKFVFSTFDIVAGHWAAQSPDQPSARCGNGQGYFEGPRIWSYGSHYLAAELFKVNGQTVALVNAHKYSRTTSGHLWSIRSAARKQGIWTFYYDFEPGTGGVGVAGLGTALARQAAELRKAFDQVCESYDFRSYLFGDDARPEDLAVDAWAFAYLADDIRLFNDQCNSLRKSCHAVKLSGKDISRFNDAVARQLDRAQDLEREQLTLGA